MGFHTTFFLFLLPAFQPLSESPNSGIAVIVGIETVLIIVGAEIDGVLIPLVVFELLARVAIAAKNARMAWAVLHYGDTFKLEQVEPTGA